MINEFKYGQTWEIWPSPLILSFCSTFKEKIQIIDNKIKQNKAQYDLDRQITKIAALSLGNVSNYEFLTGKDVLPEKNLLGKAPTIKRFGYSIIGKEFD